MHASSPADHLLLESAKIVASESPAAIEDSPAAIEALSVKNAAVKSAISNSQLMQLIGGAQKSPAVALSSVAAVRRLSDGDLSEMIRNAESHITTNPEAAAARVAASPRHGAQHVAAKAAGEVTAENAGALDLKTIASAFEAHLLQEEAAAKALMVHDLAGKSSARSAADQAPDVMTTMRAKLDKEEKAEEDKMNEHFSQEREKTIAMFKSHLNNAAPSSPPAAALPVAQPTHAVSHAPRARKSAANLHMIQHLVLGHQDSANDAQSASHAPRTALSPQTPPCFSFEPTHISNQHT